MLLAEPEFTTFLDSAHGRIPCESCHGGDPDAAEKDVAHADLIARPSDDPAVACNYCHTEVADVAMSLHGNLWGEKTIIAKRMGLSSWDDVSDQVRAGFDRNCNGCHTSCGDCHVSRPASVGGGFLDSHIFSRPQMSNNCTACHGSRVGMEYKGENEGLGADVHFVPVGMGCDGCHNADELHGDRNIQHDDRLDVTEIPRCEDCHGDDATANLYHNMHWGQLQCQVCHSQDYKSCNNCHAGEGLEEPSYIDFKVGRNPVPDQRSYAYVLLRHIPIAPDTFREWGVPSLANFSDAPTWKYTAPHNIRRWTARTDTTGTGSCGAACHNTPDGVEGWFLRQADLDAMSPEEAAANQSLIVPDGPATGW